ncbi:MAG: ABC transporter ATP-binding protein [Xenococcaceae cyanobacterium MO_188.B32]|nr:ABC transporter ATP-binding protein [Xenococcaceae cyanobacterium MO_188.B32]
MRIKIPLTIRKFLKATSFWRDNYFILREFKYFRGIAILAIIFTTLAAVFEGFGVGFILSFLQSFTNPDAAPIQTGIDWIDIWILGINAPATERLYRITGLIFLTTLLRLGFTYLGQIYSFITQINLGYRLRLRIFEQLQALSLSYFSKTRSGNLINSLTGEIRQITMALMIFSTLLIKAETLLVFGIAMLLLSWQLTIISVMLLSLVSVGLSTLLRKVREASFDVTKANAKYTSVSLEFIQGIRTVQAFAGQDFERQRCDDANSQILQALNKALLVRASVEPLSEGAGILMLLGILITGFAFLIPNGYLQSASFLTFLVVLLRITPIIRQLNSIRARLNNLSGSFDNIQQLLRTDDKPYLDNGTVPFVGLKREIKFVAVDFGYDANEMVLQQIFLTIPRGQTVALVGASGAGKSTLADLIPRFYEPTNGKILIDGLDLREFDINSLRRKLAVVSQNTFIFNASVRDNIAYAMSKVDDADIREAARLANALEFIQNLPEGFDTQLGERGTRLSGGQRQRIAIARALLRNPDILILDEATSALDSVSERLIQESIEKLSVGRTVIAIAHRLSTIMKADRVIVLEQGRIVEEGTYQELVRQRGQLWRYHQMQHEVELAR